MKNNTLKFLVIAALLLNVATLLFFWLKRPPREGRPLREAHNVLVEELNLDQTQQETFKMLREQHHRVHDSLLQLMGKKREVLYGQKSVSTDSIIQQIGFLQQEIELVTYRHFDDIRKICTPEQQSKLENILTKTVQHVLVPQGGNKRPPKKD